LLLAKWLTTLKCWQDQRAIDDNVLANLKSSRCHVGDRFSDMKHQLILRKCNELEFASSLSG
jgi:hypothetical protein